MVVFQKFEGKTTTLKFWNQKLEGKTTTLNFWNQKLEGKTTTLKNWIKRMEENSTTPKNCVLTIFLHNRSIIFLLVFSLIRFWILLRNDYCLNLTHDSQSESYESFKFIERTNQCGQLSPKRLKGWEIVLHSSWGLFQSWFKYETGPKSDSPEIQKKKNRLKFRYFEKATQIW